MSALVFMDTETTGLSLDDDIWEFAAIRREEDGTETEHHLFIQHAATKCVRLPESFYLDHRTRYNPFEAVRRGAAAEAIDQVFAGRPHVVGAVPNFDTERLAKLLSRFALVPQWHYHLIDVENLAVGYLAAKGMHASLPWDSDELSRLMGVVVPEAERHTAMGDARWAKALYDKVTAGKSDAVRHGGETS